MGGGERVVFIGSYLNLEKLEGFQNKKLPFLFILDISLSHFHFFFVFGGLRCSISCGVVEKSQKIVLSMGWDS